MFFYRIWAFWIWLTDCLKEKEQPFRLEELGDKAQWLREISQIKRYLKHRSPELNELDERLGEE